MAEQRLIQVPSSPESSLYVSAIEIQTELQDDSGLVHAKLDGLDDSMLVDGWVTPAEATEVKTGTSVMRATSVAAAAGAAALDRLLELPCDCDGADAWLERLVTQATLLEDARREIVGLTKALQSERRAAQATTQKLAAQVAALSRDIVTLKAAKRDDSGDRENWMGAITGEPACMLASSDDDDAATPPSRGGWRWRNDAPSAGDLVEPSVPHGVGCDSGGAPVITPLREWSGRRANASGTETRHKLAVRCAVNAAPGGLDRS
ncbi:unnamed protein product [Phaeothamnion confervicola]